MQERTIKGKTVGKEEGGIRVSYMFSWHIHCFRSNIIGNENHSHLDLQSANTPTRTPGGQGVEYLFAQVRKNRSQKLLLPVLPLLFSLDRQRSDPPTHRSIVLKSI